MKKAELVFIPFPFWSHLKPTIELAKLFISRDDRLSLLTIFLSKPPFVDSKFGDYVDSLIASSSPMYSDQRINYVVLPCDDYTITDRNHNILMTSFVDNQKRHVRNAVTKLVHAQDSSSRLAGFVVDLPCSALVDVAKEFGVPSYVFFTMNAGFLGLMFHLQALRDRDDEEHNMDMDITELNSTDSDTELVFPSFANPVPARVLPDIAVEKVGSHLFLDHFRKIREAANGVIVNTFMELESHVVHSLCDGNLPPLHLVGPVLNLMVNDQGVGNNDSDIIKWLDHQPSSSVLFLCFGNLGSFGDDQVKEIARALESSGIKFLWSLRQRPSNGNTVTSSGYTDSMEIFLKEFLNRTAGMGKIIGWAPQVSILSHPAVGGFVSHCGWNSILESLWFGVPVATWPLYAEQQFNAFELVKELGLSVEIKLDYVMDFRSEKDQAVVSAREIEEGIKKVMEHDSVIRKRVKEISEMSWKTMKDGGSSCSSLGRLINDVID